MGIGMAKRIIIAILIWLIVMAHITWVGNMKREIFKLQLENELLELIIKEYNLKNKVEDLEQEYESYLKHKEVGLQSYREVTAVVTAYNTVEWQTDSTPCQAAGGYICGRNDIVACPRNIPLETRVQIGGLDYVCMDRTAGKFDGRFDISFDKDIEGAINFGKQTKIVRIYE